MNGAIPDVMIIMIMMMRRLRQDATDHASVFQITCR